jgi:diguanylate cyclase (GGDEF)-like protein
MGPERGRLRNWPVWALPARLRRYVVAVIGAGAVAITVAAILAPWRLHDAFTCMILLGIGAVTVESLRRLGEPALAGKDVHGIWELAIVLLLPPFYALAAPIMAAAVTQWRVRRTLAYRRVFSAAAVGLSCGAASLVFHLSWHHASPRRAIIPWIVLAVGCAGLRWLLNHALVVTAIKLDDPAARLGDLTGGPVAIASSDAAEVAGGILVALCASSSLAVAVLVLPVAVMLERATRRAQLKHASRTDLATRLLTGCAWRREAAVQVTRARRRRAPLTVALIGIDNLQQVSSRCGQDAADSVLLSMAWLLIIGIRHDDLAGRLGEGELTVLFPRTTAAEASRVAERLRDAFRQVTIPAGAPAPGARPAVTASIGLAALTEPARDVTDLLVAADCALHQARRAGGDTIRIAGQPDPPTTR